MTLRNFAASHGFKLGCSDNSCVFGPPGGMGTNGGCQCFENADIRAFAGRRLVQTLAWLLKVALRASKIDR